MSGGEVFYSQRRLFKKNWQRHSFGLLCATAAALVGAYYQGLAYNRYNTFRGRTALYGTEPLDGGKYKNEASS